MGNTTDQIASKGAGMAHHIGARMDGLVGVFGTLAQQHAEAKTLLEHAKDGDDTKRRELWPDIRVALKAHEEGELHTVYPAMRHYPVLTGFVDRHAAEAQELSTLIDKMDAVGTADPTFAPMLDKLTELVVAHATEEEKLIFPKALEVMGADRAKELDPKFEAAAERVKKAETRSQKKHHA